MHNEVDIFAVPGGFIRYKKAVPEYIFQYQVGRIRLLVNDKERATEIHLPVPGGSIRYKKAVPEYIFQYQVGLVRYKKAVPVCTSSSTRWVNYQVQESRAGVHLSSTRWVYQVQESRARRNSSSSTRSGHDQSWQESPRPSTSSSTTVGLSGTKNLAVPEFGHLPRITRWVYQVQESRARVHLPVSRWVYQVHFRKPMPEFIFQYTGGSDQVQWKPCLESQSSTTEVGLSSTRKPCSVSTSKFQYSVWGCTRSKCWVSRQSPTCDSVNETSQNKKKRVWVEKKRKYLSM